MARWSRDELDAVFRHFRDATDRCFLSGDLGDWIHCFTQDVTFRDLGYGCNLELWGRAAVSKLLLFMAATALALGAASPGHSARPNVVIFVADDLGWADVGFHGEEAIQTPALDRLAREGVQLDRFYTTPICSPTRAALMTGREPMRLGVAYGVIMPWHTIGVHPAEHFMPQSFQAAGYQTALIGKWHLGHAQMTYHPNQRGFDYFYGHLQTEVGYFPPFANQGGRDFQRNGESIDEPGYETFLLADEASRWIRERDPEKPFFLYLPFIAPHTPLDAPEDLKAKYAKLDDDRQAARSPYTDQSRLINRLMLQPSARPLYAAVVDAMDQAIGRVLATLDEQDIADDTIVLFFSDNGGAAYATGGADNVPLRGGKGETFEGGCGSFHLTAFDDDWKLVQEVKQGLLSADVTNYLFQIAEDPYETNNLAQAEPAVVARMSRAIHVWRQRYPVAGTRMELVPPPGWRAPRDWAHYPVPLDALQDEPAPGMAPPYAIRPLDWQHGEAGRLIYDCEPLQWLGGGLCR